MSSKQEEIGEGIKELRFKIKHHDKYGDVEMEFALTDDDLDRIFKVMAKEGVAIKGKENSIYPGWFRFEPLIEEE